MKKQKYIIIISGIVIIVFAYLTMNFFSGFEEKPQKAPAKELVRFVKAMPVQYGNVKSEIKSSGRVYSKSEVILSAEVSGKILNGSIPFKEGQKFKKGDLLVRIYDKEAGLSLKASKSSFLNSLASLLPDLKVDFPDNYEKWYGFFENINLDEDLPELPEIKSTKEKVFLASRNILNTYYNIKSAESNFKKHYIYAPFEGAITDVYVEVGGIAGMNTRLGNIINTRNLELEVPLKIEDAKWVNNGNKVKVINDVGTESWNGFVSRKSGDVDIQTQSISVFIELINNQKTALYKGQYLQAVFNAIEVADVMEIPRNSLFNSNEVFIVDNELLLKEYVNVVKVNENTAFINGIEENTMVVVEPLVNASENTKVKVLEN
jgi:multidrug efflux pump subunit AcrA (membrane-fusion protein)